MRLKLLILLLLFSLKLFAQSQYDSTKSLQPLNVYGSDNKNGKFRGSLNIPTDTIKLAVKDSGGIAYKGQSLFIWNGYVWVLSSGGSLKNTIDSLRNNAGVLEARKNGVFVPQLALPTNSNDSIPPPQYADMNSAIAAGLTNGKKYRLPYNNGSYLLAVVVTAPLIPPYTILSETGAPILNENGSIITSQ